MTRSAAIHRAAPQADTLPGQSRYGGLAAALRARVLQGEWAPGDAIPAEAVLARSYGVALGTMRQALALLVEDGLLDKRQGKGTFVTPGLGGATLLRFFRFQRAGDASPAPRSRILARHAKAADADTAQALGIARGDKVLVLERLRTIAGEPCLLESIHLPLPLFAPLADGDTGDWNDLLYPLFQSACGVVVHRAEDQLRFGELTAAQARRLRLQAGHPCVRVRRRAFDMAGRCIELRTTLGDAHAFEYTAQVR